MRNCGPGKMNGVSHLGKGRERKGHCSQWRPKETNSPTGGIMTTDPVCGMRVDERESEFRTQFAGKKYFFCSEECRKEFEERPEEYLEIAA
jgi:YHS domain-containing protein